MAYRKLQYKNVQATRSTHVIGIGEVAVDPDTNLLYIGDGTTVGGNPLNLRPFTIVNAEHTLSSYEKILTSGTFDVFVPANPEAGEWVFVFHSGVGSIAVKDGASTLATINSKGNHWIVFDGTDWVVDLTA